MTLNSTASAVYRNFLGQAPDWYKLTIVAFLVLNPILYWTVGGFVTGWLLVFQFILAWP